MIRIILYYSRINFWLFLAILSLLFSACSSKRPPEYLDIHHAAFYGDIEAVEDFLAVGIPVDHVSEGMTPLQSAVSNNQVEMAGFLLQNGADVSMPRDFSMGNENALHIAAAEGYPEIAELLISYGADVDALKTLGPISGLTPLHEAVLQKEVHQGHLEVARLLLQNGADVNALAVAGDKSGTPLNAALDRGHTQLSDLLRSYGGRE